MAESKLRRVLTAAKDFNIGQRTLVQFLVSQGFNKEELKSTDKLTEEMYDVLKVEFGKNLAIKNIEQCIVSKNPLLDLGRCGLTDIDLKENSEISILLKQCIHIETLILANEWTDYKTAQKFKSENNLELNFFTQLPNCLSLFTNLKKIICAGNYGSNEIKWTVKEISIISKLVNLKYLDLSNNQIAEIRNFECLTSLEVLYLPYNQIKEIKGLEAVTTLKELYLFGNEITEITGIDTLMALERLYLSENKIEEIKCIEQLRDLSILYLSYNELREIRGLHHLTSLLELNLSHNKIADIKGLETLVNLKRLNLSNNKIGEIKGLTDLQFLEVIDLSFNIITEIKSLNSLTALHILHLSDNNISEIKGLEHLSALRNLYLSHNYIEKVKGLEFFFDNNYEIFLQIDNNIFEKEHQLLLKPYENHFHFLKELYIREKSVNKKSFTYPVKVLMLGNHASGKSSLVNNITQVKSDGSTHILRIEGYHLTTSTNETLIPDVLFYDFGGQDFYHGLYNAFISPGALQLIVFDGKKDKNIVTEDDNGNRIINYNRQFWLRQKEYKERTNESPDPYVIIQTFADEQGVNEAIPVDYMSYRGYRRSFFLSFSGTLQNEQKVDEAFYTAGQLYFKAYFESEVVKIKSLNKREEPEWYIKFIEFILDRKNKTHSPTALQDILMHYDVDRPNDEERLASLKTNLTILHRHGLVLYYPDKDLEKIAWLNPEALVKYIQDEVLSKDIIKWEKAGIVSKEAFEKMIDKQTLKLLIEQKVVFLDNAIENKPELSEYIIPNYLPLVNEIDPDYQLFTFGLNNPRFIIKFDDFIPFGFINQMICFYGKQPDAKKFWRNQLLFTLYGEARVLIKIDFEQLKIEVHFQMLLSSNSTERLITEYLFFSIMALYWDFEGKNIYSYEKFLAYKSNSIEGNDSTSEYLTWHQLQNYSDCAPIDAYISINNKDFISYKELFDLPEGEYRTKSFSINNCRINKTIVKNIPVSIFSAFTIKKLVRMKKVFISYSHDDTQYRLELQKYLVNLKRDGLIDIWEDGLIQAGDDWDQKIRQSLENADICIMLISQSFIVSNYVHEVEFRRIMEKRMFGTCRIIPILIKSCDWKNWKVYPQDVLEKINEKDQNNYHIANFQFLPSDDGKALKPINKWLYPEDGWLQVSEAIKSFCR